jgi:hypothetical protein
MDARCGDGTEAENFCGSKFAILRSKFSKLYLNLSRFLAIAVSDVNPELENKPNPTSAV